MISSAARVRPYNLHLFDAGQQCVKVGAGYNANSHRGGVICNNFIYRGAHFRIDWDGDERASGARLNEGADAYVLFPRRRAGPRDTGPS